VGASVPMIMLSLSMSVQKELLLLIRPAHTTIGNEDCQGKSQERKKRRRGVVTYHVDVPK
jgi:hypothetical protein